MMRKYLENVNYAHGMKVYKKGKNVKTEPWGWRTKNRWI